MAALLQSLIVTGDWICEGCGFDNHDVALCEHCGLALHWQLDPPLDLPRRPGFTMLQEFWVAMVWLVAAGGGLLFLVPWAQRTLGMAPAFVALQVIGSLAAAASAFGSALWSRSFHRIEVDAPANARAGTMASATVRLLPFEEVSGLRAQLVLQERFFVSGAKGGVERRRRTLARVPLHDGQPLRGRREHMFVAEFVAPLPLENYSSLVNEVEAGLLDIAGFFIPEARIAARNAREHGGFYLRLELRRGLLRRVIERRVIIYSLGPDLRVG